MYGSLYGIYQLLWSFRALFTATVPADIGLSCMLRSASSMSPKPGVCLNAFESFDGRFLAFLPAPIAAEKGRGPFLV